jgi:hypothetical protein
VHIENVHCSWKCHISDQGKVSLEENQSMSKQMTQQTMVGKRMMTRVLGQHELDGWCSRKWASSEVGSLCGRMEYATWSEVKPVKRCSTRLGGMRQGDAWSVCDCDEGNYRCNTLQDWRMRYGKRGLVTAWNGGNGATRHLKKKENKADTRRFGREQIRGAPISHAMWPKSPISGGVVQQ